MWNCSCVSVDTVDARQQRQSKKTTRKKPRNFRRWFRKHVLKQKLAPSSSPGEEEANVYAPPPTELQERKIGGTAAAPTAIKETAVRVAYKEADTECTSPPSKEEVDTVKAVHVANEEADTECKRPPSKEEADSISECKPPPIALCTVPVQPQPRQPVPGCSSTSGTSQTSDNIDSLSSSLVAQMFSTITLRLATGASSSGPPRMSSSLPVVPSRYQEFRPQRPIPEFGRKVSWTYHYQVPRAPRGALPMIEPKPHINAVPSIASQEDVAEDERRQWTQTDRGTKGEIAWQNKPMAFDINKKRKMRTMTQLYPTAAIAASNRMLPQIRQIERLKLEAGKQPGHYVWSSDERHNDFKLYLEPLKSQQDSNSDSDSDTAEATETDMPDADVFGSEVLDFEFMDADVSDCDVLGSPV